MQKSDEKERWIVSALLCILLVPLIFIIGLITGVKIDGDVPLSTDTLSSWISAFATVAIAILTFILAKETWSLRIVQINQIDELRKESIRPNLEFYLLSAPASLQFMNVHIENNGKGVARKITFYFSGENGSQLNENEQSIVDKFMKLNILRNGIAALGSGKQRTSFIFSFIDVSKGLGEEAFKIKVRVSMKYMDAECHEYSSESVIDFSEFKGVTEIGGGDPTYNLYKETEKIRKIFENAQGSMSSHRFNVNAYSSQDRAEEKEDRKKWIEEHSEKAN